MPKKAGNAGQTPGKMLKARRLEMGESIKSIAEAIKIRRAYLEAIESHDTESLPPRVYVQGYIRRYAEYLGLDGNPLVESFFHVDDSVISTEKTEKDPSIGEEVAPVRDPIAMLPSSASSRASHPQAPRPWMAVFSAGVAIALLSVLFVE